MVYLSTNSASFSHLTSALTITKPSHLFNLILILPIITVNQTCWTLECTLIAIISMELSQRKVS